MIKKQLYEAPAIEVLELSLEYSVLTQVSQVETFTEPGEDW